MSKVEDAIKAAQDNVLFVGLGREAKGVRLALRTPAITRIDVIEMSEIVIDRYWYLASQSRIREIQRGRSPNLYMHKTWVLDYVIKRGIAEMAGADYTVNFDLCVWQSTPTLEQADVFAHFCKEQVWPRMK